MAVDTASKRYTISQMMLPWRMVATVPDNATSSANRIADGYLYAAAADAPPVSSGMLLQITNKNPLEKLKGIISNYNIRQISKTTPCPLNPKPWSPHDSLYKMYSPRNLSEH